MLRHRAFVLPKFAAVIAAMPACVIGGVSLVLYGMISAVGVRNLIENQVDFQNNRNVLVAALVLVLSLGIATAPPVPSCWSWAA